MNNAIKYDSALPRMLGIIGKQWQPNFIKVLLMSRQY